ncbi:hypothetical protein [Microbacterium sp. BK668]|uniref:hypothetical protein n=1 Tax=Microbacterium sp. BK668 TaxID=2512118 RepID=UPI00105E1022|nr:hypothetical protein [Microbacterium sp. BK668]TDN91763.1 hypothetical protein EV279_1268 [Microbacterium sp. BK668]
MNERAQPLPAELGEEFSVAMALASGVRPARLRAVDLSAPFWGVRMRRGDADGSDDGIRMLRSYATRMPVGSFFSHQTAALICGVPLPQAALDAVHVSVLAPARAPAGRGVRGHQLAPELVRVRTHRGLPVASPSSTWVQLGAVLDVPDLVAAGDALVLRPRAKDGRRLMPLTTRDELAGALAAGRRLGAADLRVALGLVREGAASRPETHLRLAMASASLPEPELDFDVRDARGGRIGWTEFAFPGWGVLVEYEGDHHRTDAKQWNRDILKHDLCRAAGWEVVRVTSAHLYPDARLAVERVRAALVRAGWTPGP